MDQPIISSYIDIQRYVNFYNIEIKETDRVRFWLYCARCYKVLGYEWKGKEASSSNISRNTLEEDIVLLIIMKHFFMLNF